MARSLEETIKDSESRGVAVGHFNISDLVGLKAILTAVRNLNVPVIIGVSEGERNFVGLREIAVLIKVLKEEFGLPIFLNADHTHSLEGVEEVAKAGYDAVLFDSSQLPLDENIRMTAEAVLRAKTLNSEILVEGEIGYIGSSSKILKELPKGAVLEEKDLPKSEEAAEFVKETGIDLLAPAVGNIHGMLANIPNPRLNIKRLREIRQVVKVPLVLHGGSGTADDDFRTAVKAGISVIHINTELRVAWRRGVESGLKKNREEVAPYKILPMAVEAVREVVEKRLKLFNGL